MVKGIKEYWQSVRRVAAKLDPEAAEKDAAELDSADRLHLQMSRKEIFLISQANEETGSVGGMVISTYPVHAAELLKKQTHRLASEEEIAAWGEEMARRKVVILRQEKERKHAEGPDTSELASVVAEAVAGAIISSQKPARGARAAAE